MINPISINGPTISIRKFRRDYFTEQQLIENGTMNAELASYLKHCEQARINTLVVGGGGAGKTEIMRLLGSYIPEDLNVDSIEDIEELQLDVINKNVRPFEFRRELTEGMKGSAYDILRWGTLRSDIDIVIIGEILEDESFIILIDAMSIGQPGSFASLHADSALKGLHRGVKMYASCYPNLSENFIMKDIASTIDQVITVRRFYQDGSRRIAQISQVTGVKDGEFALQDIFKFDQERGHYRTEHAVQERILEKFRMNQIPITFNINGVSL